MNYAYSICEFWVIAVPPMLSIPNQLEGAYIGQDVALECHTEAYPTSINYWTTEAGDMIVSGNFILDEKLFNGRLAASLITIIS